MPPFPFVVVNIAWMDFCSGCYSLKLGEGEHCSHDKCSHHRLIMLQVFKTISASKWLYPNTESTVIFILEPGPWNYQKGRRLHPAIHHVANTYSSYWDWNFSNVNYSLCLNLAFRDFLWWSNTTQNVSIHCTLTVSSFVVKMVFSVSPAFPVPPPDVSRSQRTWRLVTY